MSIRQQLQQLAGEAAVPYSVVGCCEVDKYSSSLLFSWKAVLDVLCQQGDLIHGRPPVTKARLLPREQRVDDWDDTSIDESLKDFKRHSQQRYGTVTIWVPNGFSGLGIATISALLQIFGILSWHMQELRKSKISTLKTKIWEPTQRGVWTPRRRTQIPETLLASGVWGQQQTPPGLRVQRYCDPQVLAEPALAGAGPLWAVVFMMSSCSVNHAVWQVRNHGGAGIAPKCFSYPLEKFVGYSLKPVDIVQKFGPLLENTSSP